MELFHFIVLFCFALGLFCIMIGLVVRKFRPNARGSFGGECFELETSAWLAWVIPGIIMVAAGFALLLVPFIPQ